MDLLDLEIFFASFSFSKEDHRSCLATMSHAANNVSSLILQGASVLCCGLVTGSTFYISLIEVPGRADESVDYQLHNYHQIFPRAAAFMKPFGIVTGVFCGLSFYMTRDYLWSIPILAFMGLGPFTVFFIAPTNNFLMGATTTNKTNGKDSTKVKESLTKWGELHFVRTCMSLVGFVGAIAASINVK